MEHTFRKARIEELDAIWPILQQAIIRRGKDGSRQWQDGYPNKEVIQKDIEKEVGYVLNDDNEILCYCSVHINDEPSYAKITGQWLTNGDFVVYHHVAISEKHLGKGLAKEMMLHIEAFAQNHNIPSIKSDTNFDNPAMIGLFEKLGYTYCGEIFFMGCTRKAYEKIIPPIGYFPLTPGSIQRP